MQGDSFLNAVRVNTLYLKNSLRSQDIVAADSIDSDPNALWLYLELRERAYIQWLFPVFLITRSHISNDLQSPDPQSFIN